MTDHLRVQVRMGRHATPAIRRRYALASWLRRCGLRGMAKRLAPLDIVGDMEVGPLLTAEQLSDYGRSLGMAGPFSWEEPQ